jgi:hypothetical protein
MAHARLLDYKGKLQVLRQVHSDKAKHFDRLDGWLNYGTLVATIIITCVGFLGFENMKLIFDLFGRTLAKNAYDAGFNVLVLGLLIFSVLNVALGSGRTAQKHYESITNITKLLVLLDDIIAKNDTTNEARYIDETRDRYEKLIDTLPPNTDKEFFDAKRHLLTKKAKVKSIEQKTK